MSVMRHETWLIVAWSILSVCSAMADDPQWLTEAATKLAESARVDLADAREDLKAAKNGRVVPRGSGANTKGKWIFRSTSQKKAAIERAEKEIKDLESLLSGGDIGDRKLPTTTPQSGFPATAGSSPINARPGDIGTFHGPIKVLQVASDSAAIVTIFSENFDVPNYELWLDTDTTGWIDDQLRSFPSPVLIVGTKRYATAGGSTRTIVHARSLTDDEYKRLRQIIKEIAEQKK